MYEFLRRALKREHWCTRMFCKSCIHSVACLLNDDNMFLKGKYYVW